MPECALLLCRGGPPQYAAIELPNDAIALAGGFLQACSVKDNDAAALVIDGSDSLQGARRNGDAGTAHGKHHREEFLGKRQRVRLGAVCAISSQRASRSWRLWCALQAAV